MDTKIKTGSTAYPVYIIIMHVGRILREKLYNTTIAKIRLIINMGGATLRKILDSKNYLLYTVHLCVYHGNTLPHLQG